MAAENADVGGKVDDPPVREMTEQQLLELENTLHKRRKVLVNGAVGGVRWLYTCIPGNGRVPRAEVEDSHLRSTGAVWGGRGTLSVRRMMR